MKKNHLVELLKLVKWPKKIIFISIFLSIVSSVLSVTVPYLTKKAIDSFNNQALDWNIISSLIGIFLMNALISGVAFYLLSYIGSNAIYHIRKNMWGNVLNLNVNFFDNNETGNTISRLTDDIETMNDFVSDKIPNVFSQVIIIFGSIIMLFVLDWKLTLAMFTVIPVTILIILPIGNITYKISSKLQNEMANFSSLLNRVLSEIRLVKSYNAEGLEYREGSKKLKELFDLRLKEAKIQAIVSPIVTSTMMLMLLIIIGYGGIRVSNGDISAGSFVAIIFYLIQSIVPMASLSSFYTDYKKTSGATERLYEIYSLPKENDLSSTLLETSEAASTDLLNNKDIVVSNLSFEYNQGNPVLKNINLTIPSNKTTAIVGPSGSGKSTLFYIFERMYTPTSGDILIDKKSIFDISLKVWRNQIGYVMQDSSMMNGSIKHNITYGLEKSIDMKTVIKNSELANSHLFIEQLPYKYSTNIGERGVKLSGGQKQRLAIARAFMRDPKILLLDEATSSLDSESEKLVQNALDKLIVDRTTIVIAHRLSTIKNADQIVFIDKGEVTGVGNHEELMSSHEKYALYVKTQAIKKTNIEQLA